jgi:tetratricopeptide (TPR) repeat protein
MYVMKIKNIDHEGHQLTRTSGEFRRARPCPLWLMTFLSLFGRISLAQPDICANAGKFFHQHSWAEAAEAFQQCETASPGRTDALLYRGKALIDLGDYAAASSSIERYLTIHPDSDDALYLLGYVRFRQDRPRDSLVLFNRAAKLKPPEASDLKIAALDYVLLSDYDNAARYLEQSLKMNPDDLEARYHLGRVRYQQNRFDSAIAAFEEVLRHEPNNVKAEENLGLCLEAKNQNTAAIAAYHKAIDFESGTSAKSEQPYIDLGKLLTTMNLAEKAVPVLSEAVRIQPDSAPARYELGRAQFGTGNLEAARVQLEQAVRLDPQNSSGHYLLGRIYKRTGKSEQAAAQFKLTEQLIEQHKTQAGGMASGQ